MLEKKSPLLSPTAFHALRIHLFKGGFCNHLCPQISKAERPFSGLLSSWSWKGKGGAVTGGLLKPLTNVPTQVTFFSTICPSWPVSTRENQESILWWHVSWRGDGELRKSTKHCQGHRLSPSPSEVQTFLYSKVAAFNRWCQTLTSNMFMTTKITLDSESHHQCVWTWIQLIALVPSSSRYLLGSWVFVSPYSLPTRSQNEPWHPEAVCSSKLTNVLSLEYSQTMLMALLLY